MKRFIVIFAGLSLLILISVFGVVSSQEKQDKSELANPKVIHRLQQDKDKDDKNAKAHPGDANPHRGGGNGISYHGGPLILGTTNVYYIWYGNWSGNTATNILTDLAQNIGGSPYFNINTTYYNGSNVHVSNSVAYIN